MKWKSNRLVLILSGIIVTIFIAASLVIIFFFPELLPSRTGAQNETTTEIFAMDTYITMTAYGRNAEIALWNAEDKLIELEQLWSVTDPDSDIYAVNHSDGQPVNVSEETAELLKNVGYERIRLEDPTVQLDKDMMLDLGSVGKGYAGDLTAQVLKDNGITSALLDLGGNIQAVGIKSDGSPWRLGLRDPFSDGTLGVLVISDQAVVPSGNYERYFIGEDGKQYGHIIVHVIQDE